MEDFNLENREFIELSDLLKVTGTCESGGTAKVMIAEGNVKVDGEVETRRRCKIRKGQIVAVQGKEVRIA